jgi:hypothetical protein
MKRFYRRAMLGAAASVALIIAASLQGDVRPQGGNQGNGGGTNIVHQHAQKVGPHGHVGHASKKDTQSKKNTKSTEAIADRAYDLIDWLVKSRGWTPEGASIAAGNAEQESGIYWAGPAGDGGISHGIFQWNRGRFVALQAFAASKGKSWDDKMVQYEFFADEAERALPNWKTQTSLDNAGTISHAYEGYGDDSTQTRVSNAQKWLDAYRVRSGQPMTPAHTSPFATLSMVFGHIWQAHTSLLMTHSTANASHNVKIEGQGRARS